MRGATGPGSEEAPRQSAGSRPSVLVFSDYYLPGFKGGGTPRTISNLVAYLGDEFDFSVITRNRDCGDSVPYTDVAQEGWVRVGKTQVSYLSDGSYSLPAIARLMYETPCEVLYFNSLFSPKFTLLPLCLWRLGISQARRAVLAPRGELSDGALSIKRNRKRAFLVIARALGVVDRVLWQASGVHEKDDIRRWFPHAAVVVAPDLPGPAPILGQAAVRAPKSAGELKLVFLGRIAPVKNLKQALDLLRPLSCNVVFDIYGPIEDLNYWKGCQRIIATLPANVTVRYKGAVAHEAVPTILGAYHVFYLPTLGENFSHVMLEALSCGCPVLTSDRTPRRNLEDVGAGWDVPLEDTKRFVSILQQCADMSESEFQRLSASAGRYGLAQCDPRGAIESSRRLFTGSRPQEEPTDRS
ncbi:MAG: glycosyltransferase family 4 protein [Chromatiales bacterium]